LNISSSRGKKERVREDPFLVLRKEKGGGEKSSFKGPHLRVLMDGG